MTNSNWECYLIQSLAEERLKTNLTYIGATNNFSKRLSNHNNNDSSIKRRGAIRTTGRVWTPILIVSGFVHNRACLSFESGWKRLSRRRNNDRFLIINLLSSYTLRYNRDPRYNRILDLLYFVHNLTVFKEKFALNSNFRYPVCQPDLLVIRTYLADWIKDLPWPPFVRIVCY